MSLAELLHIAYREFEDVKMIDERDLEKNWPCLRVSIGKAFLNWSKMLFIPEHRPNSNSRHVLPAWRQRLFK